MKKLKTRSLDFHSVETDMNENTKPFNIISNTTAESMTQKTEMSNYFRYGAVGTGLYIVPLNRIFCITKIFPTIPSSSASSKYLKRVSRKQNFRQSQDHRKLTQNIFLASANDYIIE
jgi:hypothetical protein